jgi:hypothetical protein
MDKLQSISQDLADGKFKKYFRGGFGKRAREAEELWTRAAAKGVFPVEKVAEYSPDAGVLYAIYAFANADGVLTGDVLGQLQNRAAQLTPEQWKAEDRSWINFTPLTPPAGHPDNKKGDEPFLVDHLADGFADVHTFLKSDLFFDASDRAKAGVAAVIYAKVDGDDYILPLGVEQV